MIFAVFDPSPLTVCINCSFFTFITVFYRSDYSSAYQSCPIWQFCLHRILAMQWYYMQATTWLSESQINIYTNLLEVLELTLAILTIKRCSSCLYIDYAKVFDTVSQAKLFHKLTAYRLRYQYVMFNCITSGLIQGSAFLGALLFILYVDDLPDVLNNSFCIKCMLMMLSYVRELKLIAIVPVLNVSLRSTRYVSALILTTLPENRVVAWSRVHAAAEVFRTKP